jgi:hypothetical protein
MTNGWLPDAMEPGFHRRWNALDPGFHCVRTHSNWGFMTFQLAGGPDRDADGTGVT